MHLRVLLVAALAAATLSACVTNPSGRSQFIAIDDKSMNQMGLSAFEKLKAGGKLSTDAALNRRARCITDALVAELDPQWRKQAWEVAVFDDPSANAFALPGGKVGVHTGMFKIARNDAQLAAVIGHELAHVTHRHGAERVSQNFAAEAALAAVAAYGSTRDVSAERTQQVMALLGAGTQVGVLLPFSRKHESESDLAGQKLMASAGYDPAEAAALWRNMQAAAGGKRSPQFLSTHPDPERRIERLESEAPALRGVFEAARGQSKPARCN